MSLRKRSIKNLIIPVLAGLIVAGGLAYAGDIYYDLDVSQITMEDNLNLVGYISSDLIPSSNATYDIGSDSNRWNKVKAIEGIFGSSVTVSGTEVSYSAAGTLSTGSGDLTMTIAGGDLVLSQQTTISTSAGDLSLAPFSGNASVSGNIDVSGSLTSGTSNAFQVNTSGEVTSGTWQADVIGNSFGGTGQDSSSWSGMVKVSGGTWSAITGTANYVAYWSDTNTISAEQYLALSRGGTGTGLTADAGGIVYSGASSLAISGVGSSNQVFTSQGTGTPTWQNIVSLMSGGSGIDISGTTTATFSLGNLTSDWNQGGAYDLVLDNASSELKILESTGATYYGTFDVTDLTAGRTYTFPDASGEVSLLGQTIGTSEVESGITIDSEWDTWAEHPALTSSYILVGNASNQAAAVAMSGDVNISNTGATTIQPDSVALGTDTTGDYVGDVSSGLGINVSGTPGEGYTETVSHGDTSSVGDSSNSGNTFLQSISFDTYGHVQTIATSTVSGLDNYQYWTAQDGDTTTYNIDSQDTLTFDEGTDIDVNFTGDDVLTISHTDTSTQGNINQSNLTFIQDVTLDGRGHVTGLATNTVTAGAGLTSTGSTLDIGAGSGISVGADSVSHADTSTQGDIDQSNLTFIQDVTVDGYGHITNLNTNTVTAGSGLSSSGSTLNLGNLTSDWNQGGAYDLVLDNASSELKILESTGATYYGTFDVTDLSANRTYTFPNKSGTVAMLSDVTGDNYQNWVAQDGDGTTYNITSQDTLEFDEGTYIDIDFTAEDRLTISHTDTSTQGDINQSNLTFIQDVTLDGRGHVTGLGTNTVTAGAGLTSTGSTLDVGAGSGISVGADSVSLGNLTSNWNQGGAYDLVLDNASSELKILESTGATYYGTFDVTDLTANRTYTFPNKSGTVAMTSDIPASDNYQYWVAQDGDTTTYNIDSQENLKFVEGTYISINFTAANQLTISHTDTSTQGSVNQSNLTFIQDVTLDGRGHVTGLATNTVTAGAGLTSTGSTLDVGGGTCITANSNDVAITGNCITDSQVSDNSLSALSLAPDSVSDSEIDGGFNWTLDSDLNIDNGTLYVDYTDNRVGMGAAPSGDSRLYLLSGAGAGNIRQDLQGDFIGPVGEVSGAEINGASGVYVSGKYAYLTASIADSLTIVDISTPGTPEIVGSVSDSTYLDGARDVYVAGKYAYVACYNLGGFTIVDVSNPRVPSIVGSIKVLPLFKAAAVYVSGKHAYVAASGTPALTVVLIDDPRKPEVIGSVSDEVLAGASDVYVSGEYAYVTGREADSLVVVDIRDPTSPSISGYVQSAESLGKASSVYVKGSSGRYAYVTAPQVPAFTKIDVRDPINPGIVSSLSDPILEGVESVYVSGRYAYTAGTTPSEGIICMINIENVLEIWALIEDPGIEGARSIYVSGIYSYVAAKVDDALAISPAYGIDAATASIGDISASTIEVNENLDVGNDLYARNGIVAGPGGILTEELAVSTPRIHMYPEVGTGTRLLVDSNGKVVKETSSLRYKNVIGDYQIDLEKIMDLAPKEYELKENTANPGLKDFGLIAEEVIEVFPELVQSDSQGRPESIDYAKLSVILLEAVQKHHKDLASLTITKDESGKIVSSGFSSYLADLGLFVNQEGVLKVKKLEAQEICLGETCISEGQLKQLLKEERVENNQGSSGSLTESSSETSENNPSGDSSEESSEESSQDSSQSTEEPTSDNQSDSNNSGGSSEQQENSDESSSSSEEQNSSEGDSSTENENQPSSQSEDNNSTEDSSETSNSSDDSSSTESEQQSSSSDTTSDDSSSSESEQSGNSDGSSGSGGTESSNESSSESSGESSDSSSPDSSSSSETSSDSGSGGEDGGGEQTSE